MIIKLSTFFFVSSLFVAVASLKCLNDDMTSTDCPPYYECSISIVHHGRSTWRQHRGVTYTKYCSAVDICDYEDYGILCCCREDDCNSDALLTNAPPQTTRAPKPDEPEPLLCYNQGYLDTKGFPDMECPAVGAVCSYSIDVEFKFRASMQCGVIPSCDGLDNACGLDSRGSYLCCCNTKNCNSEEEMRKSLPASPPENWRELAAESRRTFKPVPLGTKLPSSGSEERDSSLAVLDPLLPLFMIILIMSMLM